MFIGVWFQKFFFWNVLKWTQQKCTVWKNGDVMYTLNSSELERFSPFISINPWGLFPQLKPFKNSQIFCRRETNRGLDPCWDEDLWNFDVMVGMPMGCRSLDAPISSTSLLFWSLLGDRYWITPPKKKKKLWQAMAPLEIVLLLRNARSLDSGTRIAYLH